MTVFYVLFIWSLFVFLDGIITVIGNANSGITHPTQGRILVKSMQCGLGVMPVAYSIMQSIRFLMPN